MVKSEQEILARIKEVLRNAKCKAILIELYISGATRSDKRLSFRELARRLRIHHQVIVRLVKGDKKHKAKLRGLVYYPTKGSRKGIYLSREGIKIAQALVNEKILTNKILKSIAHSISRRMAPLWHPYGTPMAPNGTPMAPFGTASLHSLVHYTHLYSNTLIHQQRDEKFSKPQDPIGEGKKEERTENNTQLKKRCECERCHELTDCEKFKFTVFSRTLLETAPNAARYRNAWLCARCYKACKEELVAAIKAIGMKEVNGQ